MTRTEYDKIRKVVEDTQGLSFVDDLTIAVILENMDVWFKLHQEEYNKKRDQIMQETVDAIQKGFRFSL